MVLQHIEPGRHPTGGGGKDLLTGWCWHGWALKGFSPGGWSGQQDLPALVGPRRRDEGFATRSPRPSPRPQMSLN
jgi:hypothetical protein